MNAIVVGIAILLALGVLAAATLFILAFQNLKKQDKPATCNICGSPYVGLAMDCQCTNYGAF